jgi:hypothetical protein
VYERRRSIGTRCERQLVGCEGRDLTPAPGTHLIAYTLELTPAR